MDAVKTLNEDFLSCSICTDIYNDPCTIGCGHTFCRGCLGKFLKTRHDAITAKSLPCPCCRQMTKVPDPSKPIEDWTKQFKPSFLIQGLLDTFATKGQGTTDSTAFVCFTCQKVGENTLASTLCIDCDVMLCDRCARMHPALPGMSTHVMSGLTGVASLKGCRRVICKEHNSIVGFCCKDCGKAFCQKCSVAYHSNCHSVVTIDSMTAEMKKVLLHQRDRINDYLQSKKSSLIQHQLLMKEVSENKTSLQSVINRVSQQAIELIKQKERTLIDKLDEITEKQNVQLTAEMKSEEIDLQTFQQYSEFIDQALKSESQIDMYEMYQMCVSGSVTADMKTNTESSVKKVEFVKDLNEKQLLEIIQLGHLSMKGEELDLSGKPRLHSTIDIKTKYDKETPDPCDVVVLDINGGETVVVTDYKNQSLKVHHITRSGIQHRSLKLGRGPYCVTRLGPDRVVVHFYSHNEFIIVELTPDPIQLFTITTKRKYICVTAIHSSTLAAGCRNPSTIDIIDLSGTVIRSLTTFIINPYCLCATNNGNLLVFDNGSGSIYCLTTKGDAVFRYMPTGDRKLGGQHSMTTTDTGDILVADYNQHKIIHLTGTGDYLREILTSQDGIVRPQGICFHKNKLYVTQWLGSVKVFELVSQ